MDICVNMIPVVICAAAAFCDIQTRKIPNWLLIIGLPILLWTEMVRPSFGFDRPTHAEDLLIAFLLFGLLFRLSVLGAGDCKFFICLCIYYPLSYLLFICYLSMLLFVLRTLMGIRYHQFCCHCILWDQLLKNDDAEDPKSNIQKKSDICSRITETGREPLGDCIFAAVLWIQLSIAAA